MHELRSKTYPQITQRAVSRNQRVTIHENTRNITNNISCRLVFVSFRVISWIGPFVAQNLTEKQEVGAVISLPAAFSQSNSQKHLLVSPDALLAIPALTLAV
jgi:hypothetical protein